MEGIATHYFQEEIVAKKAETGLSEIKYKISGISPTLMHNGRLADPLDPIAQEIKKITGKKKKTEDDYIGIARLEFLGSLYPDEDGPPCWPARNLKSLLVASAKMVRMGPKFKSSVYIFEDAPLEYSGPKTGAKLWEVPEFRKTVGVKVKGSTVQRTRPIFNNWSLSFTVNFQPSVVDESDITEALHRAGALIGLSDWRPEYGRFLVESHA